MFRGRNEGDGRRLNPAYRCEQYASSTAIRQPGWGRGRWAGDVPLWHIHTMMPPHCLRRHHRKLWGLPRVTGAYVRAQLFHVKRYPQARQAREWLGPFASTSSLAFEDLFSSATFLRGSGSSRWIAMFTTPPSTSSSDITQSQKMKASTEPNAPYAWLYPPLTLK